MEKLGEFTEVTVVCLAATAFGLGMVRLRLPAFVGYILAGIVLGPSALALIEDRNWIALLAELGVTLLLFLIGMELSLRAFRSVYRVALSACALQIAGSLAVMFALGAVFEWPADRSLLFGFGLAVSSTAVGMKILDDIGELRSQVGFVAVGVLIAQDLAVVPMLLVLEGFAGEGGFAPSDALPVVAAIVILFATVWILTRRRRLGLPFGHWVKDGAGVTALSAMTFCFLFATIAGSLGLSTAFGAFLAGLIVGNTRDRQRMMDAILPVQDVLIMVFFLSIGLLIDVPFVLANLGQVVLLSCMVIVLKTAGNVVILRLLGEPWSRVVLVGTTLGQIGEFSFVFGAVGLAAGTIAMEGYRLLIAVIVLSLVISPLWLWLARRLEAHGRRGRVRGGPASPPAAAMRESSRDQSVPEPATQLQAVATADPVALQSGSARRDCGVFTQRAFGQTDNAEVQSRDFSHQGHGDSRNQV